LRIYLFRMEIRNCCFLQASEELKVQCQMSEFSAPGVGMRKEPSIDGIEIYEVSDGSEGSIEVGKKFVK
jgi:hypothetical protein